MNVLCAKKEELNKNISNYNAWNLFQMSSSPRKGWFSGEICEAIYTEIIHQDLNPKSCDWAAFTKEFILAF